jgi:hypothetical protein
MSMIEQAQWQQIAHLVDALLPRDDEIVVVSRASVPRVLGSHTTHRIAPAVADGQAVDDRGRPILFAVRDALRTGRRFLLVPHLSSDPVEAEVIAAIRSRCRLLLHQQEVCTVFDARSSDVVATERPGGEHGEA